MSPVDLSTYHELGYLLIDVIPEAEVVALRTQINDLLLPAGKTAPGDGAFHSSNNQHAGDRITTYGEKSKHYYFHLITDELFLPIQHVFHHPRVLETITALIGGPLVINNASLFAAEPGTTYKLGWHRDVIQIPQEDINEAALFSASHFHNSVQINWPLYDDQTLWVVPGSHRRPNTREENAAFAGSKHYAPIDAEMPGAVNVHIRPGQAVLYNNNLIHRGYNPRFVEPRRSLHLGYHNVTLPPTWHFYLLNETMFTEAFRARLSPPVRAMIDEYFACRMKFPRMADTWAFSRKVS